MHLVVDPPAVRRSQHATLRCLYDLGDSPLYSVKFYRGLREFYRYLPSEYPEKKAIPFPGINVDVSFALQFLSFYVIIILSVLPGVETKASGAPAATSKLGQQRGTGTNSGSRIQS